MHDALRALVTSKSSGGGVLHCVSARAAEQTVLSENWNVDAVVVVGDILPPVSLLVLAVISHAFDNHPLVGVFVALAADSFDAVVLGPFLAAKPVAVLRVEDTELIASSSSND